MRIDRIAALAGALTMVALSTSAQFMPVIAKMRQTAETTRQGQVVKTEIKEGEFYRSSDGSVVRRWSKITVNGTEKDAGLSQGDFWDNRTATSYRLDYANRRAYFASKHDTPVSPTMSPKNLKAAESQPEEDIQGIRCRVQPAKFLPAGKPLAEAVIAGCSWMSVENVLLVKDDLTYPSTNGDTIHMTFELYDIHLGSEPDRNLFDVEKNFQVLRP